MSAKHFDPAELLQVLVEIARSGARAHISSEYRRCVGLSAGSDAAPSPVTTGTAETFSQPHTTPLSLTGPSTQATGTRPSVLHIEDTWWKAQDADEGWCRHWEEQDLDPVDPKSWK